MSFYTYLIFKNYDWQYGPSEELKKRVGELLAEARPQPSKINGVKFTKTDGLEFDGWVMPQGSLNFCQTGVFTSLLYGYTVGVWRKHGDTIHIKYMSVRNIKKDWQGFYEGEWDNSNSFVFEEIIDINPNNHREITLQNHTDRLSGEKVTILCRPSLQSYWHNSTLECEFPGYWQEYDTALGKLMIESRDPINPIFSNGDIAFGVDEIYILEDQNGKFGYEINRKRILYKFFSNGTCFYENNLLGLQRWGNYLNSGADVKVTLVDNRWVKCTEEDKIHSMTFKLNDVTCELSESSNSSQILKKVEDSPIFSEALRNLLEPYEIAEKHFSLASISGLLSLFKLATATNFFRKYSYHYSEDWDVGDKKIHFLPQGLLYFRNYYANHDYSSDNIGIGIYFIRPNNKVVTLTFKVTHPSYRKDNQMVPDVEEFEIDLNSTKITWQGSCLEAKDA